MGKGIKKVIKNAAKYSVAVVSAMMVLLITMPLLATLLINLPFVQNVIARSFMESASEKLGTRVSIDRIHVKLINRVVVDGFYVEDFKGDTLLYSKKITAPITDLGIGGGSLTFGKVKLGETEMWLRRDSLDEINIREVVDALRGDKPKNPDSNFRLRINGIEAPDITFGLLRWDKPFRDQGVDWSRFVIRNTDVDIDHLAVIKDTIRIGINSVSFDERSGFHMDRLSAHDLVILNGRVLLDNVKIKAHGANLDLPYVHLEGEDWIAFRNFLDSVDVNVDMRRSTIPAGMVGWFLPTIAKWDMTLEETTLRTSGPVAAMAGDIENARTLGTTFSLGFQSRGMPDFNDMWLDAEVRSLRTTASDIDSLMRSVTGKSIPPGVMPLAERLGETGFAGRYTGRFGDFKAGGTFTTETGDMAAEISIRGNGRGTGFDARINTSRLETGKLLNAPALGPAAADVGMKGYLDGDGHIYGDVDGTVISITFNGYEYRDVTLDGRLDDRMFDGAIHSRDPGMGFDFMGMLDFNGEVPRYNFDLDLRRANLAATNIFTRDSVALLSGRVVASGSGNNLDNLNGRIEARDLVYSAPADTVRTPLVTLGGRNTADSKQITLASDFVDAEFRSRLSYRDMFAYLKDFLRDYIPLLYDDNGEEAPSGIVPGNAEATAYSILNVRVKDTDKLLDVFLPGAQLAKGSEVSFMFNPFIRSFALSARSEYIEYRNMLATGIELNSDNKTDSLTLHLTSEDFYRGTLHLPHLAVHGGARGRRMTLTTRLANPQESFSALLGLRIDSGDDRTVRFRFTPSWLTLEDRTWFFGARQIVYDKPKVRVDRFRVYTEDGKTEELTVDGVISREQKDTLHINLNRFDLAPLSRLTEGAGYHAEGKATGYIDFISMLERTRMISGIDFEDVSLNGAQAAPTRFTSFWDKDRIRFQMLSHRTNVNVLRGTFTPSTGMIDAVAELDRLDVSLLDPILKTAIENTVGTANARLGIGGTFRNLRLDGQIDIPHFETTVQFTQARYTLENGVMQVKDSRLTLPPTTVTDPMGNKADFSLGVDLSNFRNVTFDLGASIRNLLAINTTPENNETFYGQVFATGALGIRGDKMGTRMNISATTNRGSKFYLPLSAKSNISWADFVVFAEPGQEIDTLNVLGRKKQIYERRTEAGEKKKQGKPLDLDMTINLTPDTEFHMVIDPSLGNGISAYGQGVMNMRINPATNLFSMVGDVSITEGRFEFSMMDLFTRDFSITPGSTLVWTGEPDDALLNVEGTYRVRTSLVPLLGQDGSTTRSVPIDCLLKLSGRLSQPEITFDVKAPTLDIEAQARIENAMNTQELKSMQFLSLLMMGSFMPESSLGQAGTAGSMASGSVGFDFLTNQLSNMLSSEDYNIYFRYTPQNEYTGMGSEFDVGFSKGFIDNRLILEIEGNYVDDRAANSTGTGNVSNLAGDVYLTWVIDKAGNLRLKVFTQTIDRLDENQGLQEGGIGIYYKKDFDSFRDVWRKNRDSFTNFGGNGRSERQERRRERKAERRAGNDEGAAVPEQQNSEQNQ